MKPHIHSLALLALLAVGSTGCTTYMNIRTLRPAAYNLYPVRQLVLVQGAGRDKSLQIAASELTRQTARRGYFAVEDARGQRLRIRTSRSRGTELVPAPDPNRVAAYIQINVLESSTTPAMVSRNTTVKLEDGSTVTRTTLVAVLRGTARIDVTLLAADGKTLIMHREFTGGSEMDVTLPPPPAAADALRHAVEAVLATITPRVVTSSVKLDRRDKATLPFIELSRAGNIQGAADGLEQYVREHPNSAPGYYNLAVMLDALGQYNIALRHYDRAITLGGRRWYRDGRLSCARRLAERERLQQN